MNNIYRFLKTKLETELFSRNPNLNPHSLFPFTFSTLKISTSTSIVTLCSSLLTTPPSSSMAQSEAHDVPSSSLEKQFEEFQLQLKESANVRKRIRAITTEIESATRLMQSSLLLVLEKAKSQVAVIKELFGQLSEVVRECCGQYYRYHNDWRSETQTVVSLLGFMHWLETGNLLMHDEAEKTLALNSLEFGLDLEDYLIGICFMSNELPRYVVNQVTKGDYDCPRKVLKFLTDLHAAFRMLNLRNDFLRKKFDGLKYDVKRVEEVYYDVKIRGLTANGKSIGNRGHQEQ
ncbi:Translin family [Dillenia turbinata]|uniref:Translin family n=1 Tax=Dillenia turbinata TaxID=194707 RepID=A0AAN8WC70_9MAGN